MAAGSIVIDLLMRTGSFETDTKRAEARLRAFEKEARKVAAAVGAAFVAAAGVGAAWLKTSIDMADAASKQAKAVGLSTEAFTALNYAAELSGLGNEQFAASLTKLARVASDADSGVQSAGAAFDSLGIKVRGADGQLKNTDALLGELADKFAGMPDGIQKTALATRLFGESGAKLIPMLNAGASGIEAMKREAASLGVVIGTDFGEAAEKFNDDITRMTKLVNAFGLQLGEKLVPVLNDVLPRLIELFGGPKSDFTRTKEINNLLLQLKQLKDLEGKGFTFLGYFGSEEDREREIARIEQQLRDAEKRFLFARDSLLIPTPGTTTVGKPKDKPDAAANAAARAAAAFAKEQRDLSFITSDFGSEESEAEIARLMRYEDVLSRLPEVIQPVMTAQQELVQSFLRSEKSAYDQTAEDVAGLIETTHKASDAARELGLSFSSAFEDALVGGNKLRDVLDALSQDIIRIVTRKLVTEPLADGLTGIIESFMGAASAGGGAASGGGASAGGWASLIASFAGLFADGGYIPPGQWGIAGERGPEPVFGGRTGATVVPNGGGGRTIYLSVAMPPGADRRTGLQFGAEISRELQRSSARGN